MTEPYQPMRDSARERIDRELRAVNAETTTRDDLIARLEAEQVRALSIRQPWCHHILHDGKDVENRDWPTRYRDWFLIHAGKATDGALPASLKDVPRGGIVGAARITDCVTDWHSRWWMGRYGFVLADAMPIPLVPCKGALGFFRPGQDAMEQVAAALRAKE